MTLKEQFAVSFGTVFIWFIFGFIFSLFNRLFYSKKVKFIRWILEPFLFTVWFYMYFRFLVWTCDAILNIHYIFLALFGIYLYCRFYAFYVNRYIERKAKYLNNKIINPINDIIIKTRAIIKKIKRGKKNGAKEKSTS